MKSSKQGKASRAESSPQVGSGDVDIDTALTIPVARRFRLLVSEHGLSKVCADAGMARGTVLQAISGENVRRGTILLIRAYLESVK